MKARLSVGLAGLICILPTIYAAYLLLWPNAHRRTFGPFGVSNLYLMVHLLFICVGLGGLFLCAYRLNTSILPTGRKMAWSAALILGSVFSMPVFWWFFFWRDSTKVVGEQP